jgi:hypothetical protein
MVNKRILMLDLIVIVGTLVVIAGFVGYARPLVIAPTDDLTTTETAVLFEFEKANSIFIDDNLEFSSPEKIYVEDNLVVNLKPGIYYWKVEGALSSEVRKLTIETEIDLRLQKKIDEEGFEVVNSGNSRLNVDIYGADDQLIGNVILESDESVDVEDESKKIVGGQDD